ncbi:hypothetical protein [Streptomyces narbonensis]|uniref:hypothetical protein n=1 Tax=Streptomyces narbonensis TaxID=67333 RepID=UPI0033D387DC
MPVTIEHSSDLFSGLIATVKDDPESMAVGIKARIAAAMTDEHVVMMGGWTN